MMRYYLEVFGATSCWATAAPGNPVKCMAVNTYITHNPIIFVLTYMCAHAEQQSGSAASERAVGRRGTKRQQQNLQACREQFFACVGLLMFASKDPYASEALVLYSTWTCHDAKQIIVLSL
jgi:hypothetical protein